MIVMIAAIFGFFYLLIIRPQQRQKREQATMIDSLRRGDKVVTIGGVHGRIEQVKETTVLVKVAEGVKIEFSKASVAQVKERKDESENVLQESE
ncbi:MAG: preprotein translocase subunit YajC [Verrucomicrobia bacterium]|nr:preprotein translocase subunit YajC [Verrucomicrobiota bacterium]